MKTKDELDLMKKELKNLSTKLAELSEEELKAVVGGDVTSSNIVGFINHVRPQMGRMGSDNSRPEL